jgi:hypothetical protein
MQLSKEEEAILAGESGEGRRWAMELLVALGDIFAAEDLVPIKSAQLAGVSYKTIGEAGLRWLQDVSRISVVSVPSMLNPAGMDPHQWEAMGVDGDFAAKQRSILRAYNRMGVEPTCTCTPYLIGHLPAFGDHLAWSESSAVSYVNSAIGARTNREGGPSALAAAVIGKTPRYGLHLDENRRATAVVQVDAGGQPVDYGALGVLVGKMLGSSVPFFKGVSPKPDDMKALGAAMAASGAIALYHVEGTTPEAEGALEDGARLEAIHVSQQDLSELRESLTGAIPDRVDLVALGCPHLSLEEVEEVAARLRGKRPRPDGPMLWVCTSKEVKKRAQEAVKVIERFGRVLTDTCMVVAPVERVAKTTATNSGKAACYLPMGAFCSQRVVYGNMAELLDLVAE